MTVYLFDKWRKVRRIIPQGGVTELIHDEGAYTLTAQVTEELRIITGEYLGFKCVDGRFRLFEVTAANLDDDRHVQDITATDAIVAELSEKFTEDLQQLDVDLKTAIKGILPEDEWVVIGDNPERKENSRAYFSPAWTMLQTFEQLYEWRIIPYYQFANGEIAQKVIELQENKAVFRGRILRSRKDAAKVYVTNNGRPITRLYGLGPAQGSRDLQTNMTFADVEWSVAAGDPVDKPKGQYWVGDPAAEILDGIHYASAPITDAEDEKDLLQKTWDQLQKLRKPSVKGDATISDMEMVPGHTHEQIRIGDLVALRLDAGYAVEARIIGIKRNYIRRWLTKITLGEKADTIQSQVSNLIASATHTFERLTVYQNRFEEDEELIQLNAAVIQLNAEHIQENADSIIEHAKWIVNQAEIIELKANQDDLDKAVLRLDAAEGTLTAQADTITAHGQLIQANADDIEANADSIAAQAEELLLKATQDDLEKVILRLDAAEGTLTAQAEEIYLKADKTYVDNLYAQTVKTSELKTEILTVVDSAYILGELTGKDIGAQSLSCESIAGGSGSFDELYVDQFDGEWCSWQSVTMGGIFASTMLVASGNTDLSHSHAVSVGSDGTITLGEVATTGGTFRIADTKYYKDGVSAAYDEGAADRWEKVSVYFPDAPLYSYNADTKQYTVIAYAAYFDSAEPTATKSGSYTFPATEAYNAGYQAALDSIWLDAEISSIANVAANTMYAQGYAYVYSDDTLVASKNLSKSQVFPGLGQ